VAESLGEVLLKLSTDSRELQTGLAQAQRGAQQLDRQFQQVTRNIQTSLGRVLEVAAGVQLQRSLEALARSLASVALEAARVGDAVADMADATSLATESISALRVGAELEGNTLQEVGRTLQFMQRAAVEAVQSTGEQRDAFRALGLTVEQLRPLLEDPVTLIEQLARSLLEVSNPANAAAISVRTIGKSAQEMRPLLKSVAEEGIRGFMLEAQQLGQIVGPQFAQQADLFQKNLARMRLSLESILRIVSTPLIEAFNALTPAVVAAAAVVRDRLLTAFQNTEAAGTQMADAIIDGIKSIILTVAGLIDTFSTLSSTMQGLSKLPVFSQISEAIDNLIEQATALGRVLRGELNLGEFFRSSREELQLLLKAPARAEPGAEGTARQAAQQLIEEFEAKRAQQAREREAAARTRVPVRPAIRTGALPEKPDKAAEDTAKRIQDILKDLAAARQSIPLLGEALGTAFDPTAALIGKITGSITGLIEQGVKPGSIQIRALSQELRQLQEQRIGETLDRQLATIARGVLSFGNTLEDTESRIEAYRAAIRELDREFGAAAAGRIGELRTELQRLEGDLARQRAAAEIGATYRTFAESVRDANFAFQIFGDEVQQQTDLISAYQTLIRDLGQQGFEPLSREVQTVQQELHRLQQLQVPSLETLFAPLERERELFPAEVGFGERIDPLLRQFQLIQAELERIRDNKAIDIHQERVQILQERYEQLRRTMDMRDIVVDVFDTIGSALDDLVTGVIQGTQTMQDAFSKLGEAILLSFVRNALERAMRAAQNLIFSVLGPGSAVGGGGLIGTAPQFGEPGHWPMAQFGARWTVGGPQGVDRSPVSFWATRGETVSVAPPGKSMGGNVIVNNYSSSQVNAEQRPNAQGGEDTIITIGRMVARTLTTPNNPAAVALRQTYGATPNLVAR
jgi:hypothetical protein